MEFQLSFINLNIEPNQITQSSTTVIIDSENYPEFSMTMPYISYLGCLGNYIDVKVFSFMNFNNENLSDDIRSVELVGTDFKFNK